MVVSPPIASVSLLYALHHFRLLCCVLAVALLPVYVLAEPASNPSRGELCRVTELEGAIAHYRQLAAHGEWPQVPPGPTLREGDRNERIPFLKQRLFASADLTALIGEPDVFDGLLKEAIQKFQLRHGLTPDGSVGAQTIKELNVPIGKRILQLAASIERCKLLPPLPDHRYILINIADFTLKLFEDDKLRLSMPIIVGKTDRQTPVYNGRIFAVILNPQWTIPHMIATKDILPKIKKNPEYLQKMHFRVLQGWKDNKEIDPATIDWSSLSAKHFPYRLCQDPGPGNALGRLKFLFLNPYDIYLHDTNDKNLFQKNPRNFSSGCIRLARPLDLALYLLQGTPLDSIKSITGAISRKRTQSLAIPSPIAIYIVYMTAWVDSEGVIQFRPDIYNRAPAM